MQDSDINMTVRCAAQGGCRMSAFTDMMPHVHFTITKAFLLLFAFLCLPSFALAQDVLVPAAVPIPVPSPKTAAAPSPAFFGGAGGDLDITADNSLEWHENERMYVARGHAVATRGDVTVKADVLRAFDRKKPDGSSEVWRMEAQGNVHIINKGSEAFGSKADYDIDTRRAVLSGEGLRYITKHDVVTASQSLEFYEVDNKAVAKGDAQAVRDDRKVRADEMVAYFKKDAKGEQATDRLEAKGNVHITTKDDVVFCREVTYYPNENRALLTGGVSITRGANQIQGEKAETNFKTGVSRILSAGGKSRVRALIVSSKHSPVAEKKK